ncbi:MAG TPA: Crp/Fnr family transcriptional regulator [Limnobacter sp.]|nr:Crp/Fnr family transcriptional regulator [Limnobacter sp.]
MLLEHLRSIVVFQDLDDASLKGIEHFVSARVYRAGDCIVSHSSATNNTVMALCSGMVRVVLHNPQGREMVIRDVKVGELFGDWSAIDGQPRSASVYAVKDSSVGVMSREDFLTLITHNPQIALRQMQQLTMQLRGMTRRLTQFACLKANLRIQGVLLELAVHEPEGLFIQKLATHQEIAARAYTQREVVARELSSLQAKGLLVKFKDGFLVPQPEQLDIMKAA